MATKVFFKPTTARSMRLIRHRRVRQKVVGQPERPRLCVFRSLNHIYAQLINDRAGRTVACASTLDPELREQLPGKRKVEQAALVGALLAKRAVAQGVAKIVFDRGGYDFHGRVKALAEAARKGGLSF